MRAGLTLNRVSKTITMIQLNIVVCSANDAVSSMTAWQKQHMAHLSHNAVSKSSSIDVLC